MSNTLNHARRFTYLPGSDGYWSKTPAIKRWCKRKTARKERRQMSRKAIAEGLQSMLDQEADEQQDQWQDYDGDWMDYSDFMLDSGILAGIDDIEPDWCWQQEESGAYNFFDWEM